LHLITALRLHDSPKLALIGAGGKSTAMFRLAKEMLESRRQKNQISTVILFSIFRLLPEHACLADLHIAGIDESDILPLFRDLPTGIIALTGATDDHDLTTYQNTEFINHIHSLTEKFRLPLFLELDRSNQRSLKAPDVNEPIIPDWVDHTVVFAGLNALGKPITTDWVYKPEIIADITNQQIGSAVTESTISTILNYFKNSSTSAHDKSPRICILNQADNEPLLEASKHISKSIISSYGAVITASLLPDLKSSFLQPHKSEVKYVHEGTAGVILAAGSAVRMGALKQTLPINGVPAIKLVASTAIKAGLSPVIVVTGAENKSVEQHIQDMNVQKVFNPDWKDGMSTSIKTAIRMLPPETGSAVFMLSDQPLISELLIKGLVETSAKTLAPIIAPYSGEVRGNPVLFDRTTFKDLTEITGDVGGRAIFSKYPIRKIRWNDHSSFFDMDTPEDYEKIKSFYSKQNKL